MNEKVMTNMEFAERLVACARNFKTLYVKGCFGAPMTEANKKRYTSNNSYNKREDRKKLIMAASADTFGFDCCCLPKGIAWGWYGDPDKTYGGAVYKSHGVPDLGTEGMIASCQDRSTDFQHIEIGELCWMEGHVGVYVGGGLCVECTPRWSDDVQITACNRTVEGYHRRDWTKHGKLPWIDYQTQVTVQLEKLSKGTKGEQVKTLQRLLLALGYDLQKYGADGSFGSVTEKAVRAFQADRDLTVDGSVGAATWDRLLKG